MGSQNSWRLLGRLWLRIESRRQRHFLLILPLMILASLAEAISIGVVVPYLGLLVSPQKVFEIKQLKYFFSYFQITSVVDLIFTLTLVLIMATIFSGGLRLFLLWVVTKFSYNTGADLSNNIFRRTIYQSYEVHCNRNSSEIINGIYNKVNGVISIINMTLVFIGSCIMLATAFILLSILSPIAAISISSIFGITYFTLAKFTKKILKNNSESVSIESSRLIKCLQETLGGIRDVLLSGTQEFYCDIYRRADFSLRKAASGTYFISAGPRYIVETLGVTMFILLAYFLSLDEGGILGAIPLLGALALGMQRFIPILQQGYAAWTQMKGSQKSLEDVLGLLDQPLPYVAENTLKGKTSFKKSISFKDVNFFYDGTSTCILRDVNICIEKGDRIAIMGRTGSGKTTFLDILMGLVRPTSGVLAVDEVDIDHINCDAWQELIAHVPQNIFLIDATIEENIAFGVPKDKIDFELVKRAAKAAQISESIEQWPKKYNTLVGERGVRLSGGQRQRIGIARALYQAAEIIVFDEATSALDYDTEAAVMASIDGLEQNLTIIMVTHRLSSIVKCNKVIKIENGGVKYLDVSELRTFDLSQSQI